MPCHMLRITEAHHDGRLEAAEARSVERHLEGCVACRRLLADLDRLAQLGTRAGELAPHTPLEHRRRRLDLLRAVAAPAVRRRRRPVAAAVVVAAACLAVALLVLAGGQPSPVLATRGLAVGIAIPHVEPIDTQVTSVPGTRFEREVAFADDGTRIERLRLETGTIDVEVQDLRDGQRFLVSSRDADVEVRGTRFRVSAADGRLQEVTVLEGTVELRHAERSARLAAGASWASPTAPNDAPPEPERQKPTPRPAAARSAKPSDPSTEFAAAMSELEAGNYGKASKSLARFATERGDDPRVEDAAFLVIVAMQRAGRHAAAQEAARAYLERFPNGARRAEVARMAQQGAAVASARAPAHRENSRDE